MNIDNNYTPEEFYDELRERFVKLVVENELYTEEVKITTKSLTPEEAIGNTKRKDFPIITGKDVMVQAECKGVKGQAFTDAPAVFEGTLKDICQLNLKNNAHNRGIFIATINAVMGYLKLSKCTVHCKNEGPELCADKAIKIIKNAYGNPKIGLIGYQPSLLENLSKDFELRIVDLNEANIGQVRYGVLVEDGGKETIWKEIMGWADFVLCTGSTICNGTIVNFLPWKEKTLFFGTTLAGAATLMGIPRMCFADEVE